MSWGVNVWDQKGALGTNVGDRLVRVIATGRLGPNESVTIPEMSDPGGVFLIHRLVAGVPILVDEFWSPPNSKHYSWNNSTKILRNTTTITGQDAIFFDYAALLYT